VHWQPRGAAELTQGTAAGFLEMAKLHLSSDKRAVLFVPNRCHARS
jgi:hypothetical protein